MHDQPSKDGFVETDGKVMDRFQVGILAESCGGKKMAGRLVRGSKNHFEKVNIAMHGSRRWARLVRDSGPEKVVISVRFRDNQVHADDTQSLSFRPQ